MNGAESTGWVLGTCRTTASVRDKRPRKGEQWVQVAGLVAVPRSLGSSRSQGGAGSSVAAPAAWMAYEVTGKEQRSSRHRPLS